MAALSLLQPFGRVDMAHLAGVEYLGRWAFMRQATARKSPKALWLQGSEALSQFSKFTAEGGRARL